MHEYFRYALFVLFTILLIGNSVLSFIGTNFIDLSLSLQCVQGNSPRSFSFMIQTSFISYSVTAGYSILSTGGANYFFKIVLCDSGQLIFRWQTAGVNYLWGCVGKILNDGLFHTVLVTFDGTTLTLYEDGIFKSSTIASLISTTGNNYNYLGKAISSLNFIGILKNVMFYDYMITNSYALANSYLSAGGTLYDSGIFNKSYL